MSGRPSRRGYAMMLVVVFLGLVFSFLSLSCRYFATAVRVQKGRIVSEESRNEGSILALAAGLALLETGRPSNDTPGSYPYRIPIATSTVNASYTVTFSSADLINWSVEARPTELLENPPDMPETFAEEPS